MPDREPSAAPAPRAQPAATPPHAAIAGVSVALPEHYYDQQTLLDAFKRVWGPRIRGTTRLEQFHQAVQVDGRHLALSMEETARLSTFTEANDAYIRCAVDLGARAVADALAEAGLSATDVDHIVFVSVTGIATPSIDARVANRLGFRADVKRTPIFGLGCVAGAAGLTRAADYVRAYPDQVAVLLAVELCSLTLQRADLSVRNLLASGLFGDGAAAVVVTGANRTPSGVQILACRSVLYRDTEEAMGWNVTSDGFRVVLSAEVPDIVRTHIRHDVDAFLATHGMKRDHIGSYVCHPGGPKVLMAVQEALDLAPHALAVTWDSLRRVGNLSSASVLLVLRDTLAVHRPPAGSYGLLLGMGPGFCAELVLLRW
jgi:alkylresorcinol/alkylpyrone synthase